MKGARICEQEMSTMAVAVKYADVGAIELECYVEEDMSASQGK